MSRALDNEKGIFKFVLTIIVGFTVIGYLAHLYMKNDPLVTKESLFSLSKSFSQRVMLMRAEWHRTGRKAAIYFQEYNVVARNKDGEEATMLDDKFKINMEVANQTIIRMNTFGWAYALDEFSELDCDIIWRQVMQMPMKANNLPVWSNSDFGSRGADKAKDYGYCHYHVSDDLYISYSLRTGQVLLKQL